MHALNRLRLAVIGTGFTGQRHIELVTSNSECSLRAICDSQPATAAITINQRTQIFDDYATMLETIELDGVIIATPTHLHTDVAIACIERGLPTFIENPIASTVADGRRLLDAAEEHNVPVLIGHHQRYNPLVEQAKEIIQSEKLGKLVGVSARFILQKPDDYYSISWAQSPDGGPILTNLIHDIDNLRYICGEVERVFGMTTNQTQSLTVEESAALTLQFSNGVLGTIFISNMASTVEPHQWASSESPEYIKTGQDCYYFYGAVGALAFPSMRIWYYANPQDAGWYIPLDQGQTKPQFEDPRIAQLQHFCQVIRGEATPNVTSLDGLKTLATILAVLRSSEEETPIQPLAMLYE